MRAEDRAHVEATAAKRARLRRCSPEAIFRSKDGLWNSGKIGKMTSKKTSANLRTMSWMSTRDEGDHSCCAGMGVIGVASTGDGEVARFTPRLRIGRFVVQGSSKSAQC